MEEIFLKREVFYLSLEGKVSITGRRGGRPSQAEGTAQAKVMRCSHELTFKNLPRF